jgi:hypothetical protein
VRVTAFLDASVLYPAMTRSVLIYLALADLYRPLWSEVVHDEWTRNLLKDRPDIDPARIARTRHLMMMHLPDALVSGHEPLIDALKLPDPGDGHVLAAAIKGGAQVLVTANLRHFPAAVLDVYGIRARHPDGFIRDLIESEPDDAIEAFKIDRASLTKPAMTVEDYLAALERSGLTEVATLLRGRSDRL